LCIVPEGVATSALDAWTGGSVPHAGQRITRGRLTIAGLPFLEQDDFDRLLWSCDVNFVRGEDSFVRAQWAAQAFVWQPYPQAEDAHRLKLDAFLDRYAIGSTPARRPRCGQWRPHGTTGATPVPRGRHSPVFAPGSQPIRTPGRLASRQCRISPRIWSSSVPIGYN
jgi:uncharacterized repeat protein (TIGR03837 family)